MTNVKMIVCIGAFLVTVFMAQKEAWRGIVPLHSTRADVEALIGPPIQPNGITYDLKDERVNVVYSVGGCEKGNVEWNVPLGTVIGITIYPQTKVMISDLRLDVNGFEKFTNPHDRDFVSYKNNEKGVGIGTKANGEVVVIQYFPALKDSNLRCSSISSNQSSTADVSYFKFDEYSNLTFSDEKTRLDNFAIRIRSEPKMKGYIIVYAGPGVSLSKARARGKRAKNYLVNVRGIEAARIGLIAGGQRDRFKVELYAMPSSMSPPIPNLEGKE